MGLGEVLAMLGLRWGAEADAVDGDVTLVTCHPERELVAQREAWRSAALLLATSTSYSHPRLAIRYAGMLAGGAENEVLIRTEFDHHWAKCTPGERDTVKLVCGGLGVAVPADAVVPGNLGYWEPA